MRNDTDLVSVSDVPRPSFDEMEDLVRQHPGVMCVNLPQAGKFEIDYDPSQMNRDDVREFADNLGQAFNQHAARCTLRLQGGGCEACAVKIENRLKQVPGVRHASASFLHGVLSVVFDRGLLTPSQVLDRIRTAGAPLETHLYLLSAWKRLLITLDSSSAQMKMVTIAGVALIIGFVAGYASEGATIAIAAWTVAYVSAGYSGVRAALRSLSMGVLDIDLLMVLAAIGAAVIGAPAEGAVLLFLFALSNLLQSYAVGRARKAIAALLDLRPAKALVKIDNTLSEVPVEQVGVGSIIVLKPGDRIPLDGEIVAGFGTINQAPVTGESMPVEKQPGDQVFTGTLNQEGSLEVKVTRPASDSTLARMISLVEAAQGEKAATQRFLEHAEQYYAGGVIAFTLLLIAVPYWLGTKTFGDAFYRAMAVMVVASPCALILSTPAAILSAVAGLGRSGILVKGGRHLEDAAHIRAIALDKTGTLTVGRPQVTDVLPISADGEVELLSLAAQAEALSEHPLARAVIEEAKQRECALPMPQDFVSITGRGGQATLACGSRIIFGSLKLMAERECTNYDELAIHSHRLENEGKTSICIAREHNGVVTGLGCIGLQDVLRADARKTISVLRSMGITRIVMLTGDSAGVGNAIAAKAGITEVHAGLMPEDKVRLIKEIAAETPVLMVGDGINDAPALAAANLGMAMGAAGTDVAMETADVVLMSFDLQQIPIFLETARKSRRIVTQNLVFATGVVIVLVTLALTYGIKLTLGVVGHEGSTVLVCLNGLRLLRPART